MVRCLVGSVQQQALSRLKEAHLKAEEEDSLSACPQTREIREAREEGEFSTFTVLTLNRKPQMLTVTSTQGALEALGHQSDHQTGGREEEDPLSPPESAVEIRDLADPAAVQRTPILRKQPRVG